MQFLTMGVLWVVMLVSAQPTPDDLWTWSQFLHWVANPGGIAVVVGILLSFGVEYIPKFDTIPTKWKRLVFLGLSLVVPLAAAGLGIWTDGWAPGWNQTFWPAILAGVLSFTSGQLRHGYLPDLPKMPEIKPS